MTNKRGVDLLLALTGGTIFVVGYFYIEEWYRWVAMSFGFVLTIAFLIFIIRDGRVGPEAPVCPTYGSEFLPTSRLTEIVLLNEEDQPLTTWTLYGKTGLVIGRDHGENMVNINLANSDYASTVEIEHAVLNYAAGCWYVEDLDSRNGVRIQKEDKRKYRLAPGHSCRLSAGDIIYIGLARLMVR